MSYLVFARKYRPQSFNEVVQQQHITQTLVNAIDSNRMAHAILFSGPRGTGKTTVARILAKAMNCEGGPTSDPCGNCQSCLDIASGNAADVFEIDGASNNSVDQVRELRDNCRYMPQIGSRKIYIIDEVHMLSTSAFNALLKILEEPPSHVMFIFATTEPHKIPVTILSRCQRYDLRRFDFNAILSHLKSILKKENIFLSDESLSLIAREAGGGMRDALSLLDQVVACSEGEITHDNVINILGVIDRSLLFSLSTAFLKGDVSQLIDILDKCFQRGLDVKRLYWELLEHLRNLLVLKMGTKTKELIDLPDDELRALETQKDIIDESSLFQILDVMFAEESNIKWALNPKLAMEIVFLRLMYLKPSLSIDHLIQSLDHFKEHLGSYTLNENAAEPRLIEIGKKTSIDSGLEVLKTEESSAPIDKKNQNAIKADIRQETVTIGEEKISVSSDQSIDFTSSPDIFLSKLIEHFSQVRPSLAANLEKCILKPQSDEVFVLEVSGNTFVVKSIKKSIHSIEEVCRNLLKRRVSVKIELNEDDQKKKENQLRNEMSAKNKALDHPLIATAIEIFDGKIIEIKAHKEGCSE